MRSECSKLVFRSLVSRFFRFLVGKIVVFSSDFDNGVSYTLSIIALQILSANLVGFVFLIAGNRLTDLVAFSFDFTSLFWISRFSACQFLVFCIAVNANLCLGVILSSYSQNSVQPIFKCPSWLQKKQLAPILFMSPVKPPEKFCTLENE